MSTVTLRNRQAGSAGAHFQRVLNPDIYTIIPFYKISVDANY